ncbi:hypothetical protein V500_04442 [Pseudogymnoascus sp. VKM F-4518 (FW-2643)]|nr:hypothetical protein V500_04442 [Pseudogymnoascus sp. VKM F-4518 (FW-2643)]
MSPERTIPPPRNLHHRPAPPRLPNELHLPRLNPLLPLPKHNNDHQPLQPQNAQPPLQPPRLPPRPRLGLPPPPPHHNHRLHLRRRLSRARAIPASLLPRDATAEPQFLRAVLDQRVHQRGRAGGREWDGGGEVPAGGAFEE